ncbi:MAG: hypothetical protein ACOCVA_08595 [Prolixibacteraceae bacterium]
MIRQTANIISIVFHPVLIPTLGFILLFNSGFYFSYLSWEAKRFVLLVVFFTTCILPMLSVAVMALNPGFDLSMKKTTDRLLPYIFTSVFYYIGYMLLSKIDAYPVFKVFMLASVLVIVGLLLVSLKWKISAQMAAIGGVTGALLSLSFRTGISPVWSIMLVIVVSGLIGSINLLQQKHSIGQIVAGYFLGFSVIYLVLYYI